MISLVTYPRSGSTFFYNKYLKRLKAESETTHSYVYDNNKIVITIARNPIDSISSMVAMEKFFYPDQDIYHLVKKRKQEYISYCMYADANSDIVLNFEKMIENPEATLLEISLKLGIEAHNYIIYFEKMANSSNWVSNSKSLPDYKTAKKILSSQDNHLIEDLYAGLLNKAI